MRCGEEVLILSRIAFSMILEIWDLTTMGLISSRPQAPLVKVFYRGTSLPTLRYSGMRELLRASAISFMTFIPNS